MKLAIITPSFNKTQYVLDAVRSVLSQTYQDFAYYILENSTNQETKDTVRKFVEETNDSRIVYVDEYFTEEQRKAEYSTAVLLNRYFDLIKDTKSADAILFLADDDVLALDCFEAVVQRFTNNPDCLVCYFSVNAVDSRNIPEVYNIANTIKLRGSNIDCVLDSGQVAFRTEALDLIPKPYYRTDWEVASHCDGVFLTKLCTVANFDPIVQPLLTHRWTSISTFTAK